MQRIIPIPHPYRHARTSSPSFAPTRESITWAPPRVIPSKARNLRGRARQPVIEDLTRNPEVRGKERTDNTTDRIPLSLDGDLCKTRVFGR